MSRRPPSERASVTLILRSEAVRPAEKVRKLAFFLDRQEI